MSQAATWSENSIFKTRNLVRVFIVPPFRECILRLFSAGTVQLTYDLGSTAIAHDVAGVWELYHSRLGLVAVPRRDE